MKIGVIGCGYVFDHYMTTIGRHPGLVIAGVADRDPARAQAVGRYYGIQVYPSNDALLADPEVGIVANFTSIESHHAVSRAALLAGKHVYSEKPLTMTMAEAHDLVDLAAAQGLRLSAAPSNALSATAQTLWKIVADGAIGIPRIVYAEFDDNPVYRLAPETWRSRSGAPWPYLHEYEMGCTWEHAGYHLGWLCAIFGPVRSVTAFSKVTLPDKTDRPLHPADTPDYATASLDFHSGVVARLTFSIAAPTDHRMRIIGSAGVAMADTYRDYDCPVYLEPFHPITLKARNMRAVRRHSWLQGPFGVGGGRVPLAPAVHPGLGVTAGFDGPVWSPKTWIKRLRRAQFGQQDKCAGLVELVAAIREARPHFPSPAFTLHVTELTFAIQAAGVDGATQVIETTFPALTLPETTRRGAPDYRALARSPLMIRLISAMKRR
jgi:predicted dehydrogenase